MNRTRRLIILALALGVCAAAWGKAPAPGSGRAKKTAALKPQATCPITGRPINKSLYVDADGYRIYMCCPGCRQKVKADPQKAVRTLLARGEAPQALKVDKPQTKCPIMGGKISKKIFIDANGYRIYFCCTGCLKKARQNPDAAIKKIIANGETPEPHPMALEHR